MNNEMAISVAELNCMTFEVRFDGFEALPAVKGQDWTDSPEFTCFGHRWKVQVWPGGGANSNDGKVAVFLKHVSDGCIEVQATLTVAESKSKCAAYYAMGAKMYEAAGEHEAKWGTRNFAKRSTLIDTLRDGALIMIIGVQLKQTGPSSLLTQFVPENPLGATILKKFRDETSADVVFEVSEDHVKDGRKTRAKKSPATFHAHRFVLPESGALAEACESSSDLTPIPITGTSPLIFRHLLFYLYGGKVDGEILKEDAKEIIDAADKFGVVGLKLEAEAAFISFTAITIDNVLDNLLYADSKNCALLKEAAIDAIVENGKESMKKLSFQDVPSSVITDVLAAMCREKEENTATTESGDLSTARVSTLRRKLHEKGLDVDGSREAMIARLEEYYSELFRLE